MPTPIASRVTTQTRNIGIVVPTKHLRELRLSRKWTEIAEPLRVAANTDSSQVLNLQLSGRLVCP
jgi:hypothetical protein